MQVKGLADWVVGLLVELAANGTLPDGDGDGIPDCADADIDGNGIDDHQEPGKDLTGLADTDEDGSSGQTNKRKPAVRQTRAVPFHCGAARRWPSPPARTSGTSGTHARPKAEPDRCA